MHVLYYDGFTFSSGTIRFNYRVSAKVFNINVYCADFINVNLPSAIVDHYGLALSLYLFNIEDFDEIHLSEMNLSADQIQFFEWYFVHGMAEHRYTNGFPPNKAIKIIPAGSTPTIPTDIKGETTESYLAMIGGGKDSLVGLEILKKIGVSPRFLGVNTNYPSRAVLKLLEAEQDLVDIEVQFSPSRDDPSVGAKFAGHKPGSSFWAFASTLAAYATGASRVVVANEYSANFAQLEIDNFAINHQFSKSLEFEEKFNSYVNKYLLSDYTYFSIVRPLYEIQIAKIFSRMPKYHSTFISCNITYSEGRWCKECAKCGFVYAILAPFLTEEQIKDIWGENLYERASICGHLYDLASNNVSPLECVGTPEETQVAISLAMSKGLLNNAHESYRDKLKAISSTVSEESKSEIMRAYNPNAIPSDLADTIRTNIQNILQS